MHTQHTQYAKVKWHSPATPSSTLTNVMVSFNLVAVNNSIFFFFNCSVQKVFLWMQIDDLRLDGIRLHHRYFIELKWNKYCTIFWFLKCIIEEMGTINYKSIIDSLFYLKINWRGFIYSFLLYRFSLLQTLHFYE